MPDIITAQDNGNTLTKQKMHLNVSSRNILSSVVRKRRLRHEDQAGFYVVASGRVLKERFKGADRGKQLGGTSPNGN